MASMYGEAGTSTEGDDMYANWGAGMGLSLAQSDASGVTVGAWVASAAGVAGLKFTVSSQSGRPVRVQISQVNDAAIADAATNYEQNAFGWGTGTMAVMPDTVTTIMFTDFVLPEWTTVPGAAGQMLDGSKLHSLQFQVANNPDDTMASYSFCLGSLQWVDATGAAVAVGVPMDTPAPSGGGMGGMPGGGGMGGMMPGGGGMGGMPGGGGMGGMAGGDVPSFATDIHPIMNEKCMPCHDAGAMNGRFHGQDDTGAAFASATMMPEEIAERIGRGEAEMGHMPPTTSMAGQLTQEEIDLIVAWVEGGTPE
jgi:hypothetical protein